MQANVACLISTCLLHDFRRAPDSSMHTEFQNFLKRHQRSQYVAQRFARYMQPSVLDVGCFEAPLRTLLPSSTRYVGVDIAGNPDIQLNLEQCERLPFDDASFDCVICIEVLEHLDNLHRMFDELVRVSRDHIIISLPNCWRDARRPIERGHGDFAHYGLPLERPLDRHKWFFSLEDALSFSQGQAQRHSLELIESFATEKPKNALVRALRKARYGETAYLNRYAGSLWCVFKKK